jgi:hypothetical protein
MFCQQDEDISVLSDTDKQDLLHKLQRRFGTETVLDKSKQGSVAIDVSQHVQPTKRLPLDEWAGAAIELQSSFASAQ